MSRPLTFHITEAIRKKDGLDLTRIISENSELEDLDHLDIAGVINEINQNVPEKWQRFLIARVKLSRTREMEEKFLMCNDMTKSLAQIAVKEPGWIVDPLFRCCVELKRNAIKCGLSEHIETCSRTINSALKATMIDPIDSSRIKQGKSKRTGYYKIANLLLSIYLKVRAFSLANGVINSTNTQKNSLPALETLPSEQQVPWLYYSGLLKFIDQRYDAALTLMSEAFRNCRSKKGQQILLFYLIPLQIYLNHKFPSTTFPWKRYPTLAQLYLPLIQAIKKGDIAGYRALLRKHYNFLISKHLYLIVLKLTTRSHVHLVHRVWLKHNKFDKIDLADFTHAFAKFGQFEGIDEDLQFNSTQLLLSNLIHSGELLATISVYHKKMVLSKRNPFPFIPLKVHN